MKKRYLSLSMTRKEQVLGWCYLGFQMVVLPTLLTLGNQLLPQPLSESWVNAVFFLINFLSVWFIGHRFLWTSLKQAIATPFRTLRFAFLGFLLYFALNILVSGGILYFRPDFGNINDASIAQMTKENFALISFGTVFLVPPVEEFLHRGLIFGSLHRRSPVAGYLISAVVFSAVHVVGYIGSFDWALLGLCFVQYLPAGFCLAWAYVWADNIWTPILMHITINQIGMQAMR